ncbi:alpha/beta hydrolase-fold protein [Peribacillus simplex]|uniref:alpha/beta hydrolase-fold protein n=1 Tax=Peribacillus simplex TaxID=1478 RepID=UPI00333A3B94
MIRYLTGKIANYEVCVILPSNYDQTKKYRTIYIHDFGETAKQDAHYATNPEPSHIAISGCSLGGLVSIFISHYYPEAFNQYISLSASFWYEDVLRYLHGEKMERQGNIHLKPTVNRQDHQLYLYVGELEGMYKETIQRYMVDYTKKAHLEFIKEGDSESNLLFELNQEGTHDDGYMA